MTEPLGGHIDVGASELLSKVRTKKIALPSPDKRYFDDKEEVEVGLGSPIDTRDFSFASFTKAPRPKNPIYAVLLPFKSDGTPDESRRRYIIGDPDEEKLPPQERKYFLTHGAKEENGTIVISDARELPWVSDFDMIVSKVRGNRFSFRKGSGQNDWEVTVPEQVQDKLVAQDPAERFPGHAHVKIKFHSGSYSLRDSEEFSGTLEKQVKQAWVNTAEGFDFDVNDFPAEVIHFWAEERDDHEAYGISMLRKARDKFYKLRRYPSMFELDGTGGYSFPEAFLGKRKIHMPVSRGGKIDEKVLMHELVHNYLFAQKIDHLGGFGRITTEGLANAAALLVDGWIDTPSDKTFVSLDQLMRTGTMEDVVRENANLYFTDNAILHLYLLKEKGGFTKIKELLGSASSQVVEREGLLQLYESTYRESFFDLLAQAREWYKKRP